MTTDFDETEIVRAAANGDAQAFNRLVLRYREETLLLAMRLLRNADDAEDVAQDAFVKAWQELASFRGESKFSSWLYRIVYNRALNYIRASKLRRFLRLADEHDDDDVAVWNEPDSAPVPDEILIENERRERLRIALERLPPKQRMIFVMRHEQGLSNAEIAAITGRSEGSVKANFSFAVAKLKQWMEE